MKKNSRLLTLVLAVCLIMCGSITNAQSDGTEGLFEIDEFVPEQSLKAIPASRTVDYTLLVEAERLMEELEAPNPVPSARAANDNYGGMYYANGEFTLLFKDVAQANSVTQTAMAGFNTAACNYTLNELYAVQNSIHEEVEDDIEGFLNTAIDVIRNVVLVRCDKMSKDEVYALLEASGIDTNMVRFESLPGPFQPTATIQAGGGSRNITRGSNSSASARVSGPNGNGYIVQGHDVIVGDKFGTRSGTTTGYAVARCQPVLTGSREADATYVKLNSGHSFDNTVAELGGSYRILKAGTVATITPGMPIYMSGYATTQATSDYSAGVVNYRDSYYSWSDRDGKTHNYVGVDASYVSRIGDSGGCVWVYTTTGPIWAGVQSYGGDYPSSGFAAASDVATSLNVSVN